MRTKLKTRLGGAVLSLLAVLLVGLAGTAGPAQAGTYVVAQCSPGVFTEAPDAGYATTSSHFNGVRDCSSQAPGVEVGYFLSRGENGTAKGRYAQWAWQAPPGTYITGGSAYSRIAADQGIHGYLAVTPDSGPSEATENQNDDRLHLSAIPAGQWRYYVARLECTVPNAPSGCIGQAAAHTYVKQLRIQLTDVSPPAFTLGGSMFSGAEVRGPQTISVQASDQGAGLQSVRVTVDGTAVAGSDLSGQCNQVAGGLTSRMAPCPPSFASTYTLDTSQAPFALGANTVEVCVADYTQSGPANAPCQSRTVLVDSLCPGSPVGGGAAVRAGFAENHKTTRVLRFGRTAVIAGRLLDSAGNGVAGAKVCVEAHDEVAEEGFRLLGTPVTGRNGTWTYRLPPGASRAIRIVYRSGASQIGTDLGLRVHAHPTLRLSRPVTRPHHRVYFTGRLPGPHAEGRVVVITGTVPGAHRRFLVARARTNATGRFRARYVFSGVPVATKFVFWAVVPDQNGYPYLHGISSHHYIRVRP
jgi:hypothetical protein